jgi:hypothetical protein
MWEILALAEGNGWIGSLKAERAVDFWIWCGLKPERWAFVPDQGLWEEFSEECGLYKYKGQCDCRKEKKETGKVSVGFDLVLISIWVFSECRLDSYPCTELTGPRLPQCKNAGIV